MMPKLSPPPPIRDPGSAHPVLGPSLGPYSYTVLGELAGLTQFGVHLEILHPGSRSSHRHWHEAEDEFLYMLAGEAVLIEEDETTLHPGDTVAWPANAPPGHCLENRSQRDATYLIAGSRRMADTVHYPDAGLTLTITDRNHRRFTDAQGKTVAEYDR